MCKIVSETRASKTKGQLLRHYAVNELCNMQITGLQNSLQFQYFRSPSGRCFYEKMPCMIPVNNSSFVPGVVWTILLNVDKMNEFLSYSF